MFVFLILLLQFKASVPQPYSASVGTSVELPCKNVTHDKDQCRGITWNFNPSVNTITLFERGKRKNARAEPDRLRLNSDCSLSIKKVTVKDSGRYICRHLNKSEKTEYELSVVTSPGHGTETTKVKTTRTSTKKSSTTRATATKTSTSPTTKAKSTNSSTASTINNPPTKQVWWWFIIVAVGLAVLILTVLTVLAALIRWKTTKGNKTQMDENIGQSLNPAVTQFAPETSQDTVHLEDVSYASISYTKKTNSKARVRGKVDDDEYEAVTYSTVKASSSSAGASADPSCLYATVNKPNK